MKMALATGTRKRNPKLLMLSTDIFMSKTFPVYFMSQSLWAESSYLLDFWVSV